MRAFAAHIIALGGIAACSGDGDTRTTDDATVPSTSGETETGTIDGATSDHDGATNADVSAADIVAPPVCASFTPNGTLKARDTSGVFVLGSTVDLGFGGPLPDAFVFEFTVNETGTFVLGADANADYATCHQCVRVVEDIGASGESESKQYFAAAGKLVVSPETPPYGPVVDIELVDVRLVEVGIRAIDYHSTPIVGGGCLSQASPVHLATDACVPQCGEHVCGDDGCGGTCGACEIGACSLDGVHCETTPKCVDLPLYGDFTNPAEGEYKLALADGGGLHLGAWGQKDFMQLEFYVEGTGPFDLASAPNDNYATCERCVRVVVDGDRDFFQTKGLMFVQSGSDPTGDPDQGGGALSVVLDGIELHEVTIDKNTFASTLVTGGACVVLNAPKPITRAE